MNRLFLAMMAVLMLPLTALADEPVPEEVWVCDCTEGRTLVDLESWCEDFNNLSDAMETQILKRGFRPCFSLI